MRGLAGDDDRYRVRARVFTPASRGGLPMFELCTVADDVVMHVALRAHSRSSSSWAS